MKRVIALIIIFGQSVYYFYSAFYPERSTLVKTLPIKNKQLLKNLLIAAGFLFLFITLILLYATFMQPEPQD